MPSPFVGRDAELAGFLEAFERVAAGRGPELVAVLGESGLGKTRLAQEFYRSLAATTRSEDGRGYWPTDIGDRDDNLLVNPPLEGVDGTQEMPFMWWGVRLANPTRRNQALSSAVATFVPNLEPHVAVMERAGRVRKHYRDLGIATAKLALGWVPYVGTGIDVASGGESLWSILRTGHELRQDRHLELDEAERRARDDLNERVVNVLGRLLRSTRERDSVPTILLIDDAQYSPADPGLVALFERILREAWLASWPLLILVTHWTREWHQQSTDPHSRSIASAILDLHTARAPDWAPLELGTIATNGLRPVLDDALPGLTDAQATALLERAGGQPLFLEEIIRTARQHPRHFHDRDPTNALTDSGFSALLAIGTHIVDFTHERLTTATPDVRALVCLSSLQGTRLLQRLNRRLAQRMTGTLQEAERVGDDRTLEQAVRPYAFIQRQRTGSTIAEFAQRLYCDVARDAANDLFDVDGALALLRDVLREDYLLGEAVFEPAEWLLLTDITANLLEESPDPDQRTTAAHALAALTRGARERYEPMLAAQIAERIVDGVSRGAWAWADLGFDGTHTTIKAFHDAQRFDEAIPIARALFGLTHSIAESATALEVYGDASHGAGELKDIGRAWDAALGVRRALAASEPSARNDRSLAETVDRVARWEREQGHVARSAQLTGEVLAIAERLHARLGTPDSERMLGTCLGRVGDVLREQGDLHAALEQYLGSLAIFERLHARLETPYSEVSVGRSHVEVGDVLHDQGRLAEATEHYSAALEIAERLDASLGTPSSERDLSTVLQRVGAILHDQGELAHALEFYQRAHEINGRLHTRIGTPSSERNLIACIARIGDVLRSLGEMPAAFERYQLALEIAERQYAHLGTLDSERDVTIGLERIGDVHLARGNLLAASEHYQRLLGIAERLNARLDTPNSERGVSASLARIGDVERARDDLPAALEYYRRSLEIAERVHACLDTTSSEQGLGASLSRLCDVLIAQGDTTQAIDCQKRLLEVKVRLHARLGTSETAREVSNVCGLVGRAKLAEGDVEGAIAAHELGRCRAREAGADKLELAHASDLGAALETAGADERAARVLEDASRLATALGEWHDLVGVRLRLAGTYRRLGRQDEASECLRKASIEADREGLHEHEARMALDLAHAAGRRAAVEEAWEHAKLASMIAASSNLPDVEAEADLVLARVHGVRGEHSDAIARCDRALEHRRRDAIPRIDMHLRLQRGLSRIQKDESQAALIDLRWALASAETHDDREAVALAWFYFGLASAMQEEPIDAVAPLVLAVHLAADSRQPSLSPTLGFLQLLKDDLGGDRFDATLRSLRHTGDAALSRASGRDEHVFERLPANLPEHVLALLDAQSQTENPIIGEPGPEGNEPA